MNHDRRQNCTYDLTAYLLEELGASERMHAQQHLASCDACRRELEDLALIQKILPAQAAPSDIDVQRVRARVMERVRQPKAWRPAITASACAAIALVALLSYPDTRPAPQADQAELLGNIEMLRDFEMLQSLELLEDLDLLQALENQG